MDILRSIMNGIGIGPARVKLVPGRQEYRQGEDMKGRLIIFSGHTDAAVDMIYLHLKIDTYQGNESTVKPGAYPGCLQKPFIWMKIIPGLLFLFRNWLKKDSPTLQKLANC